MKTRLRHISEYIQEAFERKNQETPSLPLSLLSLSGGRFKPFHRLVIPAGKNDIAMIDWIIVRNDCVFILAQFIAPEDSDQLVSCIHYQFNRLKQIAESLSNLFSQVNYHGLIIPLLVTHTGIQTYHNHQVNLVNINDVESVLMRYKVERRVMKPGLPNQMLRQVEQSMRAGRYRNCLGFLRIKDLPDYYWMKDFTPSPIVSCMRDYAFRPARRPQATYQPKKDL